MSKILSTLVAGLFAATMSAGVLAAEQTKAQEHKGTPAAGTVEKKEQKKEQKKDGTGAAAKKDAAPAKSDAAPAKKDAAPAKSDAAPAKKDEPKSK